MPDPIEPRTVFVGRIEFDENESYSGAALNRLFRKLMLAWDTGWLDQLALRALPGVELTQKVSTTKPKRPTLHLLEKERSG